MMKKYNTPEIEALALETIDVIATSGGDAGAKAIEAYLADRTITGETADLGDIADFSGSWSW